MSVPKFYSVDEIAELAHAPRGSVQFWIYSGRLPSVKVGRRRLVCEDALRTFLGLDIAASVPPRAKLTREKR